MADDADRRTERRGHQSSSRSTAAAIAALCPDIPIRWPTTPQIYEFFYVWADEVGDCCGPGTESVQAAISLTEVRLLCLCCKRMRVGRSHLARIVI